MEKFIATDEHRPNYESYQIHNGKEIAAHGVPARHKDAVLAGLNNDVSEKIYAMIAYVHKTYGKELDVIYEKMEELFPVEYEKYKEDTYDGPSDGEAWSGGFADNH